jgi:hypothetical protein
MPIGLQELIALAIVAAVLAFGLYRRWKKERSANAASQPGCSGCDAKNESSDDGESPVHFYRREK